MWCFALAFQINYLKEMSLFVCLALCAFTLIIFSWGLIQRHFSNLWPSCRQEEQNIHPENQEHVRAVRQQLQTEQVRQKIQL